MTKRNIKILALETSCDETAASVVGEKRLLGKLGTIVERPIVLSNIISSQIDLHAKTGGVVPEVASRAHMEAIMPVIAEALLNAFVIPDSVGNPGNKELDPRIKSEDDNPDYQKAISLLDGITHIAVTAGPGLIGSLLVGFNAAKTLAFAKNLPIIPINHIEGHIYSVFGGEFPVSNSQFPILALTVSGGHTSLTLMKDHGIYEPIGETLDDAVGEAYDKVAKLLGLGYPGGPIISKLAETARHKQNKSNIIFPRPIINDGTLNFSFSGLKTAVLVEVKRIKEKKYSSCHPEFISGSREIPDQVRNDIADIDIPLEVKEEIAAAFEAAVAEVLVAKTLRAIKKFVPKTVIFAGGVSANQYLREQLQKMIIEKGENIQFLTPAKGLYGDNAAMIGLAAYYRIKRDQISNWHSIGIDSNLKLDYNN